MSAKHPVIAVTGSSGAGTTTTSLAFRKIFAQLNLHAAEVEGDSFHRYTRPEMDMAIRKRATPGGISATSAPRLTTSACWNKPSLNTVRAAKGNLANICIPTTKPYRGIRYRGHSPRQPLPEPTDVLFYEGLHGGVVTPQHNVAQHVDLLVGVVPIVNLEWIQN